MFDFPPRFAVALLVLGSLPIAGASAAEPERPAQFKRVVECRAIAEQAQRLACYDREVAQLEAAEASKELVVVDRNQIRQTRRTLFGLSLPNLGVFGGDKDDKEEEGVSRLETTIAGVQQMPDGKWLLTLQEGGTWAQTDSRELPIEPRVGHPISVRKASLGSYLVSVRNQGSIRMKRLR